MKITYVDAKGWKATPTSDPLYTIHIEGVPAPAKTYDSALLTVGEHAMEKFQSKSGKEYWRTPKTAPTASTQASAPFVPNEQLHIRAQWAISQAIQIGGFHEAEKVEPNFDMIEVNADQLFAMVDRVKVGQQEVVKSDKGDFATADLPPVELYE